MRIWGFVLLLASSVSAPAQDQSPAELIKFWTHQELGLVPQTFTCGSYLRDLREDQKMTDSLVELGASAIPDLEVALDSIETQGWNSPFSIKAPQLLHTYAKIVGAAALPRIRRMAEIPKVHRVIQRNSLDDSYAAALRFTSYVSRSRSREAPASGGICGPVMKPQYFLDYLILAWERNDRRSVEAYLGPNARTALKLLLKGRSWGEMRANLWRGKSGSKIAIGYKLEPSEPQPTDRAAIPVSFELEALLKDSSGVDCGRHQVKFRYSINAEAFEEKYLIDNSDLGDLLRAISSCAAATNKKP